MLFVVDNQDRRLHRSETVEEVGIRGKKSNAAKGQPKLRKACHPSLSASTRTLRSKIGRPTVNVRPLPSLLSSDNSPPYSRTIRLTISKPSPDPADFVVK